MSIGCPKHQGGRLTLILMQDNVPAHIAEKITNFVKQNNYDLLDHPAHSPYLNPLYLVMIKQVLLDMPLSSSADDLYMKIKQIWDSYPIDKLLKYIKQMASHIKAIIQAKG